MAAGGVVPRAAEGCVLRRRRRRARLTQSPSTASMLGGHPQLKDPAVVTESFDRVELSTETRGSVHVELQLLVKGFGIKGVEFAGLDGAEGGGEGAS